MTNSTLFYLRLIRNSIFLWVMILQWFLSPIMETRFSGFFLMSNAYAEKDVKMEEDKNNCKDPMKWTGTKCVNGVDVMESRREAKESVNACANLGGGQLKDCQEKLPYIQAICDKEVNTEGSAQVKQRYACYNSKKNKSIDELKEEAEWVHDGEASGALSVLAGISGGVAGVNLALALIGLIGMKSGSGCASRVYFSVVSAAYVLAEIYFYFFLESKLRDLQDEYKDKVAKDGFGGQKEAFDYVISEQDAVADVHNTKFTVYVILGAAYAIGAIIASLELMGTFGLGACTPSINTGEVKAPATKYDSSPNSIPINQEGIIFAKNFVKNERKKNLGVFDHAKNILFLTKKLVGKFLFEQSYAEAPKAEGTPKPGTGEDPSASKKNDGTWIKLLTTGIGAAVGMLAFIKPIKIYIMTSAGVAIISTVSSALAFMMAGFSKSAANEAEEHKALVERLLKVFTSATLEQCDTRDDLANPKCYCYQDDGKKNPSRSNSQTCQTLWANDGIVAPPKALDKALANSKDSIGCVTISGQFDENCKCKQVKQSGGRNLCKNGFLPQQINSLGNASGMNDINKKINDMNNGGFGKGKYIGGKVVNNAARIRKLAKALKDKNAKLLLSKGYDVSKDNDFAKALVSKITKADIAKFGPGGQLAALANSTPAGLDSKALKDVREKALSSAGYLGGGLNGKKESQAPAFSFGGDSGSTGKDLSFMEKKYDYKENDIVKSGDASIWQVISNRYNVSGLRRLFDDGTPMDLEDENEGAAKKVDGGP